MVVCSECCALSGREASAKSQSLVQRSPTLVCVCVHACERERDSDQEQQ